GTLPPSAFHHREHVRVAWLYLKTEPPLTALARFASGLQRFAAARCQAGLYHETITWAYLLLIRERMEREGNGAGTWKEFAESNPDLLSWKPSILDHYYRPETLGSELARRVFVLPDRASPLSEAGQGPRGPGGGGLGWEL
ncbi:MAG TPA: hypothetical protein VK899_00595, partial [Gemmatimonadales bacterium]|nr:hypothetical protein [Gemmatimonadales bacterium]